MKKSLLAGMMTLALAGTAFAHTRVKGTSPADGSTVAATPAEFVLNFNEAARLTALSIQPDGGKEQKIDKLPGAAAAQVKIAAPRLANGHYTLSYRIVGDDGHIVNGKIAFTVGGMPSPGKAPAAEAHGDHAGH